MSNDLIPQQDIDAQETPEWIDALQGVIDADGSDRARYLLKELLKEISPCFKFTKIKTLQMDLWLETRILVLYLKWPTFSQIRVRGGL